MKKAFLFGLLLLLVTGCAPKYTINKNAVGIVPDANQDMAQVVFVRPPAFVGGGTEISVYDFIEGNEKLLGVLTFKTYTIANLEPGKHTLFGHCPNTRCSYLNADLEAGKTYYILIRTWMGAFKGGMEIRAVNHDERASGRLQQWMNKCRYTNITQESHTYAEEHRDSRTKWCANDYEDHQATGGAIGLRPEQGMTSPIRTGDDFTGKLKQ